MKKALVTGGGGFVGGAVARRLLEAGWSVRSLSRGQYPELAGLGIETFQGDIADEDLLAKALRGCDAVFHAAAKVGLWGPEREFYRVNVTGTLQVVRACRHEGVGRLIFTSSPSVVFDGKDIEGADESIPYPKKFDSAYSRTKALAEEIVLTANDENLATVALRPHLIWGPGDGHIVAKTVAQAKAGALRRIGAANKFVDTTYIDNAAEAHLLAAERLKPGSPVAGNAYFISQGEPRRLWDVVNAILGAAGVAPVQASVSPRLAQAAAWGYEVVYGLLGLRAEPRLTRFLVAQLTTAHWFNIGAARRDLSYEPRVSIAEGLTRLKSWFARDVQRIP